MTDNIPKRGEFYSEGNMGHYPPIFKILGVVDGYVIYRRNGCAATLKRVKEFTRMYPFREKGY